MPHLPAPTVDPSHLWNSSTTPAKQPLALSQLAAHTPSFHQKYLTYPNYAPGSSLGLWLSLLPGPESGFANRSHLLNQSHTEALRIVTHSTHTEFPSTCGSSYSQSFAYAVTCTQETLPLHSILLVSYF